MTDIYCIENVRSDKVYTMIFIEWFYFIRINHNSIIQQDRKFDK